MAKKQPEVTEATRRALIDAFCLIAKEKPIEKITIQEITRKAGYNRCTFYQYFKDVYDLLEYVEGVVISHVKDNFQQTITQDDFRQTFFDAFTRIQQEKAPYFNLLLSPANYSHFTEKLARDVMPVFMERFHIAKEHPFADYLVNIYFSTVISAISLWIQHGRTLPLSDLSELLGNVLTNGVMDEIGNCKQ